jgi:hypothetical protein
MNRERSMSAGDYRPLVAATVSRQAERRLRNAPVCIVLTNTNQGLNAGDDRTRTVAALAVTQPAE